MDVPGCSRLHTNRRGARIAHIAFRLHHGSPTLVASSFVAPAARSVCASRTSLPQPRENEGK